MLKLVKLMPDCEDIEHFERINNEAFPDYERMSMEETFAFAADTDTDILGIYSETAAVGFAVLLKNEECAYLYYIAIDRNMRSKGYGGEALKRIIEMYPHLQIILDFEEIDITAKNIAQRQRRKAFYLKNGFKETGRYTLLNGHRFEVVCSGEELKEEAFKRLLDILHAHRPGFPNVLI